MKEYCHSSRLSLEPLRTRTPSLETDNLVSVRMIPPPPYSTVRRIPEEGGGQVPSTFPSNLFEHNIKNQQVSLRINDLTFAVTFSIA
jgi:hypothetical protein